MAANAEVEELRKLVIEKIEEVCCSLVNNRVVLNLEDVLETIDQIVQAIHCLDSVTRLPENIYQEISAAKRIIENSHSTSTRTPRIFTGVPGRPCYDINENQLQSLLDVGFNIPQISELLQVSKRTIERRLAEYCISARSYTTIVDEELDNQVKDVKLFNPNIGSKNLAGYLASRNIKVPRQRIRESLQRVDPLGVAARRCRSIHRRVYCVSRPLALWHFDGNHKLIRWRLVVHGCIDGFSRIPVFLACHTNNRASTVLSCFIDAIRRWGVPSRTRCDMGGENIDVVRYMINRRGTDRGSALVGRSVHNQRIERLWRDVFSNVLELFHGVFMSMEDVGILDPINETDLWCLHFCFCDIINHKLKQWVNAWIRHPLSSERNLTPLQLWVQGQFDSSGAFERTVSDDYGIDWEGPAVNETDDEQEGVQVATAGCPLNEDQLNDLKGRVEHMGFTTTTVTPWESVRYYQFAKHFVENCF